ncbi:hypothetical protein JCM33374_g6587 [Metschnikowia sp. JCM 33374]|nr:hypothetical protein JCM33374_g6587 [Metschnikowia sp. JCM 33374]
MSFPRSPLFPDASLTLSPVRSDEPSSLVPQLPASPLFQTSSLQIYIVPAEKHLFVQGFKPAEFEARPPTLLRGSLILRVIKPNKIKSVSLSFRGSQRTDWPEGIPPKRISYFEINDLVNHSWPFYQADTHQADFGADIVVPAPKSGGPDDVTPLSLEPHNSATTSPKLYASTSNGGHLNIPESTGPSFAQSLMKMATSTTHSLSPASSFPDLSTVLSGSSNSGNEAKPGHFPPGDYVYNFEHPIPASSPETASATFGSVNYYLEANVTRSTTFKSHLSARLPIEVVRIPSDNSVEENEPIIIERDWEDQMRYEIVVASKSVVLDSYLPMTLKFIPLFGKVALHRIRVYISEDCSYYCSNKTVHRTEPSHKYLLLEHKAKKHQSLLSKSGGRSSTVDAEDDEVLPRELEFQVFVPSVVNKKFDHKIHPDTAVENIQCNHWIKISLRISKRDPANNDKRKHFEISIDSPIHLFSPLAAHNNTLLPVYIPEPEFLPEYTQLPPNSPGVTSIDASLHQTHSSSLFSVFGSPAPKNDPPEHLPRPTTPIQFQHITSSMDNDDPIERDHDIHLESNLYKPENDEVLSAIGSPQATAFSPIASPIASPVRAPIEPSMDPPSFNIMGVTEDTLPPAYEQETLAMNLSPLRLDSRERSPSSAGIKEKLNKQFDSRSKNSSEKASLKSDQSSTHSSKGHRESQDSGHRNTEIKTPTASRKNSQVSRRDSQTSRRDSQASRRDSQASRRNSHVAHERESAASIAPSTDITDLGVPSNHQAQNSLSRNSSLSSSNYRESSPDDSDIDQTLPLLYLSSSRNDSRLSVDSGRQIDPMGSMNDLVTYNRLDDLRIPNTLTHFRNPRLSKHYQEDPADQAEEQRTPVVSPKPRQKSFGVIPDLEIDTHQSYEGADESKARSSQFDHSPKDTPYIVSKEAHRMMSN